MQELNRRFRQQEQADRRAVVPVADGRRGGDIAISREIAASQCRRNSGTHSQTELKILILHGLLHLAGYDHETDDGEMTAREAQLRQQLGLPFGLIERTDSAVPRGKRSMLMTIRATRRSCSASKLRSTIAKLLSLKRAHSQAAKRGGRRA